MRTLIFTCAAVAILLLWGCGGPVRVENPRFARCADQCATAQNQCVVDATSGAEVNTCNQTQATCVQKCEAGNPRYILRER